MFGWGRGAVPNACLRACAGSCINISICLHISSRHTPHTTCIHGQVFRALGVHMVVRLNAPTYRRRVFKQSGFSHHDLVFDDCSVPPNAVVDSFLKLAEGLGDGQVMAVHCLAGLGRTGTLIALYLMKHLGFTANEAIGWMRICRPGSVIGPQQQFLADQEDRMHQLGAIGASGLGKELGEQTPIGRISSSPSNYTATTGLCQSRLLAEMVTDGMLNRAQQKKEAAGREADAAAGMYVCMHACMYVCMYV